MSAPAAYPDARAAVADLLGDLVQATYVGARTLGTIQSGKLPALRVTRTGGADDGYTDTTVVGVAVFAGDPATAESIAESCRQRLAALRLRQADPGTAAGLIDSAQTLLAPQLATSPDVAQVQCSTASYKITMRRTAA